MIFSLSILDGRASLICEIQIAVFDNKGLFRICDYYPSSLSLYLFFSLFVSLSLSMSLSLSPSLSLSAPFSFVLSHSLSLPFSLSLSPTLSYNISFIISRPLSYLSFFFLSFFVPEKAKAIDESHSLTNRAIVIGERVIAFAREVCTLPCSK